MKMISPDPERPFAAQADAIQYGVGTSSRTVRTRVVTALLLGSGVVSVLVAGGWL